MSQSQSIYPIGHLEHAFVEKKPLWLAINRFIQNKKLGLYSYRWDDEIFIPIDMLLQHFNEVFHPLISYYSFEESHKPKLVLYMAAIAAWRYNLGAYNIPDYLYSALIKDQNGYRISPKNIQRIGEWTIYIQLNEFFIFNQSIHGVHVHKNILSDGTPCLVLFFNNLISGNPDDFDLPPYALFRVIESNNILDALIECSPIFDEKNFLEVFNPIFSLINLIGDQGTTIESEIFGIYTPTYKDVKENTGFSEFNMPFLKYVAPSNLRIWNVGLNIAATHFKLATLYGEEAVSTVMWSDDGDFRLIHPHI